MANGDLISPLLQNRIAQLQQQPTGINALNQNLQGGIQQFIQQKQLQQQQKKRHLHKAKVMDSYQSHQVLTILLRSFS